MGERTDCHYAAAKCLCARHRLAGSAASDASMRRASFSALFRQRLAKLPRWYQVPLRAHRSPASSHRVRCYAAARSPCPRRFHPSPPAPDRIGRGLLMAAMMPVRQRLRDFEDVGPLPWARRHGPDISNVDELLQGLRTCGNESLDGLESIPLGGAKS